MPGLDAGHDSSCGESPSIDWLLAAAATEMSSRPEQQQSSEPQRQQSVMDNDSQHNPNASLAEEMPPPPRVPTAASTGSQAKQHDGDQTDDEEETRLSRSTSNASRNPNRLSLTLPIAPPTSAPTRPTPTASNMASYPPTPVDVSTTTSPTDTNEFIIAIAAQERRVMEIREELARAEGELKKLKKHFTVHEAHKKRAEIRKVKELRPLRVATDTPEQEDALTKRSVEIERRKSLLLNQGTPKEGKRRVFQGGHTRTLSLLSPTKTTIDDGFPIHEDADVLRSPGTPSTAADADSTIFHSRSGFTPAPLSHRASWAPRSSYQAATSNSSTSAVASGVKQFAEDFTHGLWTFVEDIRQATVGDEPISGARNGAGATPSRSSFDSAMTTGVRAAAGGAGVRPRRGSSTADDHDTIRASAQPRPRAAALFEDVKAGNHAVVDSPSNNRATARQPLRRAETMAATTRTTRAAKHFSWTPLTFDAFDDSTDWSNWDSPTVKSPSPRWSGSTANGDSPAATAGGEKMDAENKTPLRPATNITETRSTAATPSGAGGGTATLEDLSLSMLNRLTPSNLKKTASDFMKEWERSLSPPLHHSQGRRDSATAKEMVTFTSNTNTTTTADSQQENAA